MNRDWESKTASTRDVERTTKVRWTRHQDSRTVTIVPNAKDSPVNGTSTSVEPAMSDRRGELEAFPGFSSSNRCSKNCPSLKWHHFHREIWWCLSGRSIRDKTYDPDNIDGGGSLVARDISWTKTLAIRQVKNFILKLKEFVQQLEDSEILAGDTLKDGLHPPKASRKDVEELARELIRQKKLTKYQAQEVYRVHGYKYVE